MSVGNLCIGMMFMSRESQVDAAVTLAFAAIYGRGWHEVLHSTARDMAKRQTLSAPNGFDIDRGSQLWDELISVRSVFAELVD